MYTVHGNVRFFDVFFNYERAMLHFIVPEIQYKNEYLDKVTKNPVNLCNNIPHNISYSEIIRPLCNILELLSLQNRETKFPI